ncbi:MAG: hypothetical protein R3C20_08770 [Planctomycetaceae bacterium]
MILTESYQTPDAFSEIEREVVPLSATPHIAGSGGGHYGPTLPAPSMLPAAIMRLQATL